MNPPKRKEKPQGILELKFPFSALTLLVWRRKSPPTCKKQCWFVGDDLTGALHILQLHSSPPPSSLDAIKPAKPASPGKAAIKTDREKFRELK